MCACREAGGEEEGEEFCLVSIPNAHSLKVLGYRGIET